jgi:hypothetical protein
MKPLGRPGNRCQDDVNIVLKERVCENVDYINLAQNRAQW